ncbi:hypothetical protein [Chryseobacterium sp. MYb328]|uniref:hypothetical protein n=1 Tax=Chryseobacterium sp. MYb328 TaxID=2745231 RepID=UPI003094F089
MGTVKEVVLNNRSLFYKLNKCGVKNIETALDYLSIYEQYENQKHIDSNMERKKVVAVFCKVTVRTVEIALQTMKRAI